MPFWTIWIILPLCMIAMIAVVVLENEYYNRHPEKERPDVNPWP